ncbi:MAG: hypothetical protein LUC37_02840 [Prevotella sp.]|nr:hypothetical protein [Prevotella sp.]
MANTMSVATISDPEFINLQPLDINPMMSTCEIKVLYVGANRNGSYITKDVATEMAKTLRGAPIVGYYREEKEDFTDHGDKVTIDDEGIKFECMTQPYGFVAPDAQVWFQNFDEQDEFGNTVEREYLMTTGYLWTGQYEEAKLALEEGRPQSMELDSETLDGHWAENSNNGMEFFIINDAIFSKLCILGEDVEPCFEGASITAPDISASFTLDDNFRRNLYTMMQELQDALKGGMDMDKEKPVAEDFTKDQDETGENTTNENQDPVEDEDESSEEQTAFEKLQSQLESEQDAYDLLQSHYSLLEERCNALQQENKELRQFKEEVELQQKRDLIQSFYMLSDEDKKDVNDNIAEYSLDDIEAKLSVICVRKKVDFSVKDDDDSSAQPQQKEPVTYNLNPDQDDSVPAWVSALRTTKNNMNN